MHPDLYPLAAELVRDRHARAARRRQRLPEPRPPGHRRHRAARLLVRLAVLLTDEPVVVIPTPRRRLRLVRRA